MAQRFPSDYRYLVLIAPQLEADYPELVEFGRSLDWRFYPDRDALGIELGSGFPIASLLELVGFLRGVLDGRRLAALRALWLNSSAPLRDQLDRANLAEPLLDMASSDTSPLLDILKERRLDTWYQPVVHVDDQATWGFECLARAYGDSHLLINGRQLLAWARQENLYHPVDRICRESHLANAAKALSESNVRIFINLLPQGMYDPELCLRTTVAIAEQTRLVRERVYFELVEVEEFEDWRHLRRLVGACQEAGFQVALDNVTNAHVGLSLLTELKTDLVKIDHQLINRSMTSSIHRQALDTLTRFARDQGKLIVAEGIERPAQLDLVRRFEIELAQGYLLGAPASVPVMGAETATLP